jgi:hypothetical protein
LQPKEHSHCLLPPAQLNKAHNAKAQHNEYCTIMRTSGRHP